MKITTDGKYRIGANQVAMTTIGNVDISTVWVPYAGGSFETILITDGTSRGATPIASFSEADALKAHVAAVTKLVESK